MELRKGRERLEILHIQVLVSLSSFLIWQANILKSILSSSR